MRYIAIAALVCVPLLFAAERAAQSIDVSAHASKIQATNFSHTLGAELAQSEPVIVAYAIDGDGRNGPAGSVQPGVAVWDPRSGVLAEGRQINLTPGRFDSATENSGHDAPYVAELAHGGVMVTYGAMSTYHGYTPPREWSCFGTFFCQPFKIAARAGRRPAEVLEALADGPEYHLPSTGLSEAASITLADVTVIAGQEQTTSPHGQAGTQGYVTYHATGALSGYFDTVKGPYDFHAPIATAADGMQTITLAPKDNAYFEFAIWSVRPGVGTIGLRLDGAACELRIPTTNHSPASMAAAYVRYFNESADRACAIARRHFRAVRPAYDTNEVHNGASAADATIGIDLRSGDVTKLPPPPQAECDGRAIACDSGSGNGPNSVLDLRDEGYGEHRHFLYSGMVRIGKWFYSIVDVQQVTHSWYVAGHNGLALALACFRSDGPHSGVWTWTDCTGRNVFTVGPGIAPAYRLGTGARDNLRPANSYLIGPPSGGYPAKMTPFSYDYSMEAQPQPGEHEFWPVVSAESVTRVQSGNLLFAYECFDRNGTLTICYLEYDVHNGVTRKIGFVDVPSNGGSLVALALSSDAHGAPVLGVLTGAGDRWGCGAEGACAIRYTFSGGAWHKQIAHVFGGSNNAAAPGVVQAGGDGRFYFQAGFQRAGRDSVALYALPVTQP